jgi:hypothetical protein
MNKILISIFAHHRRIPKNIILIFLLWAGDYKFQNQKIYKLDYFNFISNLWIVSMIPGDLAVAGCFNFSKYFGDKY